MENQGNSKKRHQSEEVPQKEHESTSLDRIIIQEEYTLNIEESILINGKNTHTGKDAIGLHEDRNSTSGKIFSIDYSKTGSAKCKHCKKTIAKGIVRIGKKVPFKVGEIIRFFHIDCVFQTFRKAKVESSTIRDVSEIDGIEFIPSEVKSRIENLIADTIEWIKKPLVKPAVIINKYVSTGHSVPQKMKLKQLGSHTLKVMFTNADQMTSSKIVELKKLIEIEKPLIVAVTGLK